MFALALTCTLTMMVVRPTLPNAHLDVAMTFFLFPLLVVSALRARYISRVLSLPALRWLGFISFSLYLVQFPVQCAFHAVDLMIGLRYGSPLVFAAFLACSLGAGYILAHGFEWPVYRLFTKRRLDGSAVRC